MGDHNVSDDKIIQFVANYDDWVSIKKIKITKETDPINVAEFLAGLSFSFDRKIEENIRKKVALDKLDAVIKEIPTGKKEAEIATALSQLNSRKVSSVIKEITELDGLQKNEQKELAGFCQAYATRKVLNDCKLAADYSKIEIPGMKKVMKTKV